MFFTFSLERGLISFHHLEDQVPRTTTGITYTKPSPRKTHPEEKKNISHGKAWKQEHSVAKFSEVNDWTSFSQLLPTT